MVSEEDIEFQRVVMEGLVPKMESSDICVSLCPQEEGRVDAKFCVELGVMIMLDKPIIAVRAPGAILPKKLELVADKIVDADITTEEGRALLMKTVGELRPELLEEQ